MAEVAGKASVPSERATPPAGLSIVADEADVYRRKQAASESHTELTEQCVTQSVSPRQRRQALESADATTYSPSAPPEQGVSHSEPPANRHGGETVILVHGLWTPAAVFSLHSHWLQRRGYRTRRFGYPSVRSTLSQNAHALQRFIAETSATEIHLVGHSMGGLIILELLATARDPRLRRAVFLGTPCLDSHCARRLVKVAGMPSLLGRSIMEWLTRLPRSSPSPATTLFPEPVLEIGVLAGTRGVGLGCVVPGLPRPNDGVVAVAETRLPGAADFIALPVAHSQMLASPACAAQIAAFLESGRFLHA